MSVYSQFEKLCRDSGRSISTAASEMNLNRATFTAWKRGAKPKNETLKKIADHFGVTVEWLLSDDPLPGTWQGHEHSDEYMPLTAHEKLLLDTWRSVDRVGQEHLLKSFMAAYNDEILRMRGISFEDER